MWLAWLVVSVADTHRLVLARGNQRLGLRVFDLVERGKVRIVRGCEEDESQAAAIIRRYTDKVYSLTAAISRAVTDRLRTGYAFAIDRHFAQYGVSEVSIVRPQADSRTGGCPMAELPRLDPLSAEYVALSFAIERHIPGYVDAYVGPPSVRDAAAGEPVAEPERLLHRAQSFMARIADAQIPDTRVAYLSAQAQAMIATCRRLAGEDLAFADEVRLLFDIPAERVPEADFDAAIAEVDRLLPGDGAIPERMAAWRRTLEVAPERAMAIVEAIVPALRERTEAIVPLPDGEAAEFRLVSDEPWGGYNWFLGQGQSRVELNTDLPIHAHHLLDLICHEAYPGHHVEHALKERLYLDQGWGEHAIQLINTPECVISEGIATQAASAIFPGDELAAFQAERVYPAAGVDPGISAEAVEQIAAAERVLLAARGNAALMLHADGVPDDEVIAYLRRYRLRTKDEARQDLRFIADPLWRAYTFTYHVGYDLLGAWIDRAADPTERAMRFRTLVSEQVYPSRVEAWIAEEAADARS